MIICSTFLIEKIQKVFNEMIGEGGYQSHSELFSRVKFHRTVRYSQTQLLEYLVNNSKMCS